MTMLRQKCAQVKFLLYVGSLVRIVVCPQGQGLGTRADEKSRYSQSHALTRGHAASQQLVPLLSYALLVVAGCYKGDAAAT